MQMWEEVQNLCDKAVKKHRQARWEVSGLHPDEYHVQMQESVEMINQWLAFELGRLIKKYVGV